MISIVIPTLNEEKTLEKSIRRLREYNGDFEIIVSDGKSTDKTVEIAKKYAGKVIIYDGQKRQTIGMGRNLGASVASGDYYVFLDTDIGIPNPNQFFFKALSIFQTEPKLVGLTVYIKVFPEVATITDKIVFWILNRVIFIQNNILHRGAGSGGFQMIKADSFKKLSGFNEKLVAGEDLDMFLRLSRVGLTRSEPSLFVFDTSRRAHKIGWPKLLYTWFMDWIHSTFFKRARSKVWEEIR